MQFGRLSAVSLLLLTFVIPLAAQRTPTQRVPMGTPPGWPQQPAAAGLPWPEGLGRSEAITGHIAAIDKDQIMVKSYDYGEVLFWVDDRTVVRVDKFPLALTDLRVGDPVAVRLKKVKGKGPYATEILPHPDVRARKERGEKNPPASSGSAPSAPVSPDSVAMDPTPAPAAAAPAAEKEVAFPSLPSKASGVVGTVTVTASDSLEIRDTKNQTQKVLVTSVTGIKAAGTNTILPSVDVGDRVAVVGDRLDSGEWIAREILVNRAPATAGSALPAMPGGRRGDPGATTARAAETEAVSPDGLARFSGTIVSLGNEEIRVRTATGERTVLVTGITEVRRMGIRGSFASLKKGDEVSVVGDPLQGGIISAREITVTKLAGS